MLSFGKLVDFGSAALHVYVMYQNISEWLTVDYLITCKVLHTLSHICFHQKSTTLVYVLEVIHVVMHFLYSQITFINAILFPDVYFVFFHHWIVFPSTVFVIVLHLTFAFVISLISKRY